MIPRSIGSSRTGSLTAYNFHETVALLHDIMADSSGFSAAAARYMGVLLALRRRSCTWVLERMILITLVQSLTLVGHSLAFLIVPPKDEISE